MTELKREYVVPLRARCKSAPRWRRSKRAVSVLKDFIRKHMKTDEVIVCSELNEHIWANGAKNPPGKVTVIALRTQVGTNEKTLVNLLESGVDKYVTKYKASPVAATPVVSEEKAEIKDAEVKEVAKEEAAPVKEKKAASKKEVKKDE